MSSEKFELNQDDLDSLLERVGAALRQLATSQGEARKRTQQVRHFLSVLRIRDPNSQCCGTVTIFYGSGSSSYF